LVAGAACGDADRPAPERTSAVSGDASESPGAVDVSVLRRNRDGRILGEPSPERLARSVSTVVQGTIASWADGPVVIDHDERDYSAVLEIKVTRTFKGEGGGADGQVYVYFPRGGEVLDADGEAYRNPGARDTVTSIDELRRAAPPGTRILFLGNGPRPLADGSGAGVHVEHARSGLPDGAPLLRAHAQGLLLDDDGRLASAAAGGEPWGWFDDATKARQQFELTADRLGRALAAPSTP
jgi:hypothetical protein